MNRRCLLQALALYALAEHGTVSREIVAQAIRDLGVDPEKIFPEIV